MPIDFPSSPSVGATYSYSSITWTYNGIAWDKNTVSGASFSSNVQISGDLLVTGRIVTETGIFGVTYNNTIESIDDMSMDGGEF